MAEAGGAEVERPPPPPRGEGDARAVLKLTLPGKPADRSGGDNTEETGDVVSGSRLSDGGDGGRGGGREDENGSGFDALVSKFEGGGAASQRRGDAVEHEATGAAGS